MASYDLTFVAPHRRDEVLRRIRVLDRFIQAPGRAAAEVAAADLGLGVTQLYRLAKVWRMTRKPEELAGAAKPQPRRTEASERQQAIVRQGLEQLPDASIERIATQAIEVGSSVGVQMPAIKTVRKLVEMMRVGRVSPNSPAVGADVVIAHCPVDIAVQSPDGPVMPVAALVIDATGTPRVIGLALSIEGIDAGATARALIEASAAKGDTRTANPPTRFALDEVAGDDWTALRTALSEAGYQLQGVRRRPPFVLNDAVALIGRKPAGLRLMPGLLSRGPSDRPANLASGAKPLSLQQAEELVRTRLLTQAPGSPLQRISAGNHRDLIRKLAAVASS
jgi:hypothetical protein